MARRLSDGPPTHCTESSGTTDAEDDKIEIFGASQYYGRIGSAARERLETLADRLSSEGLETEPVVAFGSAAEEIVRVAETAGCHLTVMVIHGKNFFGRTMLGGVTSKVLRMSRLPTLAIRPEQAQRFGALPEGLLEGPEGTSVVGHRRVLPRYTGGDYCDGNP